MTDKGVDKSGWDSRTDFARQIVYRIGLFLDMNIMVDGSNLYRWMERYRDLHDLVRAWYDSSVEDQAEKNLKKIESYLFDDCTNKEKIVNKKKAEDLIRKSFNLTMKEIKKKGLLLPDKETFDDVEDFNNESS